MKKPKTKSKRPWEGLYSDVLLMTMCRVGWDPAIGPCIIGESKTIPTEGEIRWVEDYVKGLRGKAACLGKWVAAARKAAKK